MQTQLQKQFKMKISLVITYYYVCRFSLGFVAFHLLGLNGNDDLMNYILADVLVYNDSL